MQNTSELITVQRDCEAILIPSGDPIKLIKGTHVRITQALGGDFTLFVNGNLVKISGKDGDAIGKKTMQESQVKSNESKIINEDVVWEQLRTVYDPEIPVNIVELGLVYDLKILKKDEGYDIQVKMTLTAPGCGMGPVIAQDVEDKLMGLPNVLNVTVELVWDPAWNQSMMTDAAKLELGML